MYGSRDRGIMGIFCVTYDCRVYHKAITGVSEIDLKYPVFASLQDRPKALATHCPPFIM